MTEYAIAYSNSFYPAHHISTGEGGMVCSDDSKLMKIMISMAWWGRDCSCIGSDNMLKDGSCKKRFGKWLDTYDGIVDHKYIFSNIGFNLKPLDLQGAIGVAQLAKFDTIELHRKVAKKMIEYLVLENVSQVRGVYSYPKADVCWFGTPFICDDKEIKNKLVKFFEDNKIQTRNYFAGNILMHPGYKDLDDYKNYPVANTVLDRVFFLGAAPHYGEVIFNYIDEVLSKWEN